MVVSAALRVVGQADMSNHWQLTLFGSDDHPLLEEIRPAKLNEVTPLEALRLLHDWQQRLAAGASTTSRQT